MSVRSQISVRFHLPAPELRGLVTSYYVLETGDRAVDDHLHPEWANIRISLSGRWTWSMEEGADEADVMGDATLFGPTSRAARITASAGAALWGIGLLPHGWACLIGRPASDYANHAAPLADILGETVAGLRAGLQRDADDGARVDRLNRFVLERLEAEPPVADPILSRMHAALMSGDIATVASFAQEVGVSERTLERLCPRMFGFAPKPLLRRQRFLRAMENLQNNPGRTLFERLDEAYFDQAHFVREFHAFMGSAPTAYFAQPRDLMRVAGDARRKLLGQSLQGLHAPALAAGVSHAPPLAAGGVNPPPPEADGLPDAG